jgi:NAD(P)-dependent dehydrogenase (short-subunit alcohol dehydrogenase family)
MLSRSILITGCSSGIGLDCAIALKQRGYRVFACARKMADVEKLNAFGLEGVQLDVNDAVSMQRALDTITARTGGTLDALFNNAGFLQAGAIEDLSRDMIRAQFETNVFGPMELIRLVLPIMRKQGHGRIIQNSSILGVITLPYYGAYNASKYALEGFSATLRQECRGTGIFVSIINPGPIASRLRENAFQLYQQTLAQQPGSTHAKAYEQMEQSYFQPSERDQKVMQNPSAVTKKLLHALESSHPHTHYFIGWPAIFLSILRRLLPDKALDWLLAKFR